MQNVSISSDLRTTVSTEWLAGRLGDPELAVIDATWHMPDWNRDARAEHAQAHIPGAVFFDVDKISDRSSPLPQTAPDASDFTRRMGALGTGDGQEVVVYDGHGLLSAARVWWTFRLVGKSDVAVLDGGLPKWRAERRPMSRSPVSPTPRSMSVRRDDRLIRDADAVLEASRGDLAQIVDTRSEEEFEGRIAGPADGLRAGRIPTSKSLPFDRLLDADDTLKAPADLRRVLSEAGVDLGRPIIATCLVGMTASILALALESIGHRDWSVYDGSWAEWGANHNLPLEIGTI